MAFIHEMRLILRILTSILHVFVWFKTLNWFIFVLFHRKYRLAFWPGFELNCFSQKYTKIKMTRAYFVVFKAFIFFHFLNAISNVKSHSILILYWILYVFFWKTTYILFFRWAELQDHSFFRFWWHYWMHEAVNINFRINWLGYNKTNVYFIRARVIWLIDMN